MSVISGGMLAMMRAQVLARLPDTAVIQSVANVSDGAGGVTPTWGVGAGGTVLCRVDPLGQISTESGVVASREAMAVRYRVTMPYDAPINVNNRVVIDGDTYEVVSVTIDHSWNVSKRVIVSEVR